MASCLQCVVFIIIALEWYSPPSWWRCLLDEFDVISMYYEFCFESLIYEMD